ncbi:MAG: hypothetical protein LBH14_07360 [Desulfobulbaceae bacterium]|nr:hypothetical protein [Desulfobulbaceae bacterium]
MELGAGQGRDSLFFASQGFHVHALDYSSIGVSEIEKKPLPKAVRTLCRQCSTMSGRPCLSPTALSMPVMPICFFAWP